MQESLQNTCAMPCANFPLQISLLPFLHHSTCHSTIFIYIHPYSTTCHCLSPVTFERIRWWQSWQALKAGELMTTGWYAPSKGKYANLEGGEGGPCGETGRLDHFGPAWTSLDFGKYTCWFDISFCARNRLSRFQDRLRQRWCFLAPGYHGYRFASRSPIWTRWRSLLLCDQDKNCSFLANWFLPQPSQVFIVIKLSWGRRSMMERSLFAAAIHGAKATATFLTICTDALRRSSNEIRTLQRRFEWAQGWHPQIQKCSNNLAVCTSIKCSRSAFEIRLTSSSVVWTC